MKKLDEINILGVPHKILYKDKPSEVDICGKQSLWGQIAHWEREIRIYDNGRTDEDIFHTLLHEVLHSIQSQLNLKCFDGDKGHEELDMIALALTDVMVRNNIVELEN